MKRILLPLVETERSLKTLQYVKVHYKPEDVSIILTMVDESLGYAAKPKEEKEALARLDAKLAMMKQFLDGYDVFCQSYVGKAGAKICKCAREYDASYILMCKSSREDMLSQIGKTAEYVIVNAPCNTIILSEAAQPSGKYKGLVYTKAHSVVNLRGQLGDKQSECLLPSVKADCNYRIEVTVGKVRFYHTAYNPVTRKYDLPPQAGQEASVDISAGQAATILVKAGSTEGKADRIRVLNRGMKQEAVFTYLITPVRSTEAQKEAMESEIKAAADETMAARKQAAENAAAAAAAEEKQTEEPEVAPAETAVETSAETSAETAENETVQE